MTALEREIRRIIAADGPISVEQFMALCLGHPSLGYYITRDPFGVAGDFTTAPEVSQMFGELIGLWAAAIWQDMGRPAAINLVELGPGRGTLMADALRASKIVPEFASAIHVSLVETSPVLRERQRQALEKFAGPVTWFRDVEEFPEGPLIVIANEFFDALPVHQMVRAADGWHERMVGIDDADRLTFALHPEPVIGFERFLPSDLRDAPVGSLYEWRADHIMQALSQRIVRFGGAALVIDYGHAASHAGETLQAVRRHHFVGVLETPGECDLTAHVDFAALARSAQQVGTRVFGPLTQNAFLRALGIEARASRLKTKATPAQARDIDVALARLIGPSPDGMGDLFKVLAVASPGLAQLPGFDS
ncbi:MAG TPA: SAM-dependent methyltransferase [Xanthobacteraceae bacterium]|nr:SAM-dependent methyltransferase [Xanthobacteraceae bacterium]